MVEADTFISNTEAEEADRDAQAFAGRLSWENVARCLVIAGIVVLVAMISWRPALLRSSQLMFLVSPSHGDSLAWKPDGDEPLRPTGRKHTLAPSEWRLTASSYGGWKPAREATSRFDPTRSTRLLGQGWDRFTYNPWSWQDDAPTSRHRMEAAGTEPEQQPFTAFRATGNAVWTEGPAVAATGTRRPPPASPSPAAAIPQLSSTPLEIPALQPLPGVEREPARPSSPDDADGDGLLELPPLSLDDLNLDFSSDDADEAPVNEDWINTEITRPISGAYLTIYPKLKFVGLCVPGQGYIRKYNQVAVPTDLTRPKYDSQDGRTPYGKYYVAARTRDDRGPVLTLSWPSPEDAERAGLMASERQEIENAWLAQRLPPQNTPAGGGVDISGDRDRVEETDGGFALEEPHMEEVFMALPDGAWVFIQP